MAVVSAVMAALVSVDFAWAVSRMSGVVARRFLVAQALDGGFGAVHPAGGRVKPLLCKQFEKPAQPYRATEDNWPLDEQPAERKPFELTVAFSIQGERK